MKIGKLIVFEGIEEETKTAQIAMLSKVLAEKGVDHVITQGPGTKKNSAKLRSALLPAGEDVVPYSELLMQIAAILQLNKDVIKPAMQVGKLVLCESYIYSVLVNQGIMKGLSIETYKHIEMAEPILPDLSILLNCQGRIDQEYLNLFNGDITGRMQVVNIDDKTSEVIHEEIINIVGQSLQKTRRLSRRQESSLLAAPGFA